jgi:DNA helicase-2/ATP-dependent DNA helicase PcrA
MEERVDTLVPYGYADVQISTFHAFGDRLIKENALELGLTPDFRVLTRAEQVIFLRDHLFEFPLKHYRPLGDPTRHLQAFLGLFSRLKDEDVGPDAYLAQAEVLLSSAADDEGRLEAEEHLELARTYAQYQTLMARLGQIDFGDQIVETLRLFRTRPHVLRRYQERFKYILVDEFQDTNYAQNEIVERLAERHRNLAVVADDDQSIYKWRGAAISNVLQFKERYPDARDIVLTENYRCPQEVLDSAYRLIQFNNPDRLEVKYGISKKLVSMTRAALDPRPPRYLAFDTLTSEADQVADLIVEEHAQGRPLKDFAILVRANNDADAFLRALNTRDLPWTFSGNAGLYGRPEIRLLISFLRTVAHPDESVSLHYLASSDSYQVPIVDLTSAPPCRSALSLALRRAPGSAGGGGAERGGRGGGAAAGSGSPALHGAGARNAHRRALVPVSHRFRAHDSLREGSRRAGAGSAECQQVLRPGAGCRTRAEVRYRARVRESSRCVDRCR